ncbi:two pore domain potassium channel family protein [Herbaspirillum sp. SJZ107]|uniref:two pore domain potassium channel family protein n=1 Tax=Herbaspirillum sp. SJZ107 TaxID=2572881 RepID=UPI001153F1D7|nr:two pore domain potassium channel family protein [Herbaspirillum sp. SJZ107]TQK02828.1 hypothetical protein FBX97_5484 [Herbaspirillum sp. SJZ107]
MAGWIEQLAGALVILCTLLDIFLTALYAKIGAHGASRAGAGIISLRVARATWWLFRHITGRLPVNRDAAWSFCGAVTVVCLVLVWSALLALGAALMLHPALGEGVRSSSSPHVRDFLSALYVGGSSLSIASSSDFYPQTGFYRLLYLVNALIGTASISVTITYVLQIYSAVLQRNALGLSLYVMTKSTADPAVLLCGLGPQGRFDAGYTIVANLGSQLTAVKEAHHLYPLLFFYRPYQPANSIPQIAFIALDMVALLRSALNDDEYRWLKESAAVENLGGMASILVRTLEGTFLPGAAPDTHDGEAQAGQPDAWDARYRAALRQLEQAGIRVRADRDAGAQQYARMRQAWHPYVERLARYMDYDMAVIDPATASACNVRK